MTSTHRDRPSMAAAIHHFDDAELNPFALNVMMLESLIFRTETEILLDSPNVDRLWIFMREMQSLKPELQAQQARTIAANGAGDEIVRRLQLLLSGRLTDITARAESIAASTQEKLETMERGDFSPPIFPPPPPVDSAIEGADDGNMEPRIKKLEDLAEATRGELRTIDVRLTKIETRLEGMDGRMSTMATKADVAGLESTMLKWFIGTTITMVGLAFAAAKLIH